MPIAEQKELKNWNVLNALSDELSLLLLSAAQFTVANAQNSTLEHYSDGLAA